MSPPNLASRYRSHFSFLSKAAHIPDALVLALNRGRNLKTLCLDSNKIGRMGCSSLARLLRNQEPNIEELYVDRNTINYESTIVLADSLAEITNLKWRKQLYVFCRMVGHAESCLWKFYHQWHTLNNVGLWFLSIYRKGQLIVLWELMMSIFLLHR